MVGSKEKEKKKDTAQEGQKDKDEKNTKSKKLSEKDKEKALILWFEDLTNDDVAYVGGKNASLGEMYRELTPKGIKIPNGFAVTAHAYNHFLNECNLLDGLSEALEAHHVESRDLKRVGKRVRKIILEGEFPEDLSKAIVDAYRKLGGGDVAVRSSATAEDLPEASFAGQQESYLNVEGEEMVLEACKKCMASLFTNRAISYREDKGFDHFDVYLSVGVMKMVRSDKACAGTMFTIDTETGFADTIVINGDWGLGENVVQGSVNPDEWTVFKPTLKKDFKPLIRKVLGSKKQFMVYGGEGTTSTINMETSEEHRGKFCLENEEVLQLAKWGIIIEDHYSKRKGKKCPMDIEWAKDGNTNEIFIVQARPETVQSQKNLNKLVSYKLKGKREADDESLEEATEENAKELNKEKGDDEKGAEKAKQKLGGKGGDKKGKEEKGKGEEKGAEQGKEKENKENKEKKSYKKSKKTRSKKEEEEGEEEEEDSGSEDDLKLITRKKHKSDKKEDNELIKEAEEEGKGEAKGDAKEEESKEKEKDKEKEKEKDKKDNKNVKDTKKGEEGKKGKDEGKEKEGKEKEGKEKEGKEKEGKEKDGKEKDGTGEADAGKIAMRRHEEFSKDKGEKAAKEKKGGEKEGKGKEKGKEEKGKEGDKEGKEKEKGKEGKGDKGEKASSEHNEKDENVLTSGAAVGSGIAAGKARMILNVSSLKEFNKGEILVTEMTDPDWEPILKLAAAIVTDSGGRTCHAAIIARELGIPCIVGCSDATSKIETGDAVTVDCARGDQGVVLEGLYDFEKTEQDLGDLTETKTKIMMNVANPDRAFELSFIPNAGVGLGRLEFIVNNHIGIHPLAALHPDDLNEDEKEKMLEKARGYKDPRDFFVSTLAHGVGTITAAFYPKPVIVRFSDFKTNEYANLLGGKHYEPKEDNPMLGWRGAARYYDPTYREAFALECEAMKRVREEFGLTNLRLMIPMLRTVEEAKRVLEEMEKNGIKKSDGEDGLKVMAMCEVPANCILAEQFLELLDGFSIGSNDLTQMTLGVDRDSEIVNDIFDERNEAVKAMIAHAIKVCRKLKKYVGICGQAPSDYHEFAKWLVDQGIESMSLNPDTVLPTTLLVSQRERGLSDEEIEKENKEKQKKAEQKAKKEGKEKKAKEEGEEKKSKKKGGEVQKEDKAKKEGKEKEGKDKEGKEKEGKEKEGKEKEGEEKEGKEKEGKEKEKEGKEKEGKEKEGKEKEGKAKEGKEKEGKENEGKGKEGKETEGKEKEGKKKEGKKEEKEKEGKEKKMHKEEKESEDKEKAKEEENEKEEGNKKEKDERIEEIHKELDKISEKVGDLSDELHQLTGEKNSPSGQPAL